MAIRNTLSPSLAALPAANSRRAARVRLLAGLMLGVLALPACKDGEEAQTDAGPAPAAATSAGETSSSAAGPSDAAASSGDAVPGADGAKSDTADAPAAAAIATAAPPAPGELKLELLPPQAWPAPRAPAASGARAEAPPVLALLAGDRLIPVAVQRESAWKPVDALSLDKLPEGRSGKDAAPELLQQWWKQLDLRDGDRFELIGERGARGSLTLKLEFVTADRGGCTGLVVALPGSLAWDTRPSGTTLTTAGEPPAEQVWALRAPWTAAGPHLARAPVEAETAQAARALELLRTKQLEAAAKGGSPDAWKSCDALNEPPCKNRRHQARWLDLDGNGVPELLASYQLRSSATSQGGAGAGGDAPTTAGQILEHRVLLGLSQGGAYPLGQWAYTPKRGDEESQLPFPAGALDLTGDGRAELIFRQSVNEVENWEIFQAVDQPPGALWTSLVKTSNEGC